MCGIAGVYLKEEFYRSNNGFLPEALYMMLLAMQPRGQESTGISVYNPNPVDGKRNFRVHKDLGRVKEVFLDSRPDKREELMKLHQGKSGIGNIRYVTSSSIENTDMALEEAQPFYRRHFRSSKRFVLSWNGTLANYGPLEKKLKEEVGYDFETNVDTELLMALFALNLQPINGRDGPDWVKVVSNVARELDGAYSVVILEGKGDLIVFKDPYGIRPLVYGENERLIAVASESSALDRIGIKSFFDIEPGQLLIVSDDKITKEYYTDTRELRACCFEHVYFSFVNSRINGVYNDAIRERLGQELARIEPLKGRLDGDYVVVPVPNTSIPAAYALAESLDIKVVDGLIRNESVGRAFIEKEKERKRVLENKFTVKPYRVRGKKVIAVDDSIVRGDTSMKIVNMLREAGADEVHMRSTFPPVKSPCFYGIDFPSFKELIATKVGRERLEEYVAKEINADSVLYQTIEGMIKAIGTPKLCMACLNMEYPTEYGRIMAENK